MHYFDKEGNKTDVLDVIDGSHMWTVGKSKIISLAGIQKIADKEGVVEKEFRMLITPTKGNNQQHGVSVVVGWKGDEDKDNWKRASGEASILNTGKVLPPKEAGGKRVYEEFTKVDSKFRLAMADKRAYVRAVARLIRLYGVYCDVEASEFSKTYEGGYDY